MHLPTFLTIKTDGRGNKDGEEMGKKFIFCPKAAVMTQCSEQESSEVTEIGQDRRMDFQPQGFCLLSIVVVCSVVVVFLRKKRGSSPKVFIYI